MTLEAAGRGRWQVAPEPVLRVELLGPLRVTRDDVPIEVAGPAQRALLCVLAMHADEALSPATVIDALWAADLPASPTSSLQIVVSRLRTALGAASAVLESVSGQYRLAVTAEQVDADVARRLLDEAREARRAADPDAALRAVDTALALWRGEPLAELDRFPFTQWAIPRLAELRSALSEERNDALLAAGRHLDVVEATFEQVRHAPWRETLRAQQMVALYRAGRQAEALQAYEEVRSGLAEDLGLVPSPQLVRLHAQILQHDPALDVVVLGHHHGRVPIDVAITATTLPFVGRDDELSAVHRAWDAVRVGGGPALVVLTGEPGIGKTRLALEAARQAEAVGVVMVCRQDTASASGTPFDAALRHVLAHLPVPDADRVRTLADAEVGSGAGDAADPVGAAVHALGALAPVFVLFDDAHRDLGGGLDVLARLLSPDGPDRLLVVATARNDDPDGWARVNHLVDHLEPIGRVVLLPLAGLEPAAVERLLELRGHRRLPRLGAALHTASGGNPFFVGEILRDLPVEGEADDRPLAHLPTHVHEAVRHRVARLGAPAARVLRVASVLGSRFSPTVVSEVGDTSELVVRRVLDRAIVAGLVEPERGDRFVFAHDLARQSLVEDLPDAERTRLHALAARILGAAGVSAHEVAEQWRGAGESHRSERRASAQQAAEAAEDPFAAAHWWRVAVDAAVDERDRHTLLVELAHSQHAAGDGDHRANLLEAGRWAQRTGDQELLIRAGMACANGWSSSDGVDEERLALLDAAAAAAEGADQAWILASIATELTWSDEPRRRSRVAERAITAARGSADRRVLVHVLTSVGLATACPQTLSARVDGALEALDLSSVVDDVELRLRALGGRMAVAVELGDLATVDECLAASSRLAASGRLPVHEWGVAIHHAWRHALTGDLDGAEDRVDEARARGRRSGQSTVDAVWGAQRLCLRWQQGRLEQELPMLEAVSAASGPAMPSFDPLLALARHLAGDVDAASAAFDHAVASSFPVPDDVLWGLGTWAWTELAAELGRGHEAGLLARRLSPYQHQVGFIGAWVLGPLALPAARGFAEAGFVGAAQRARSAAAKLARALEADWLVAAAQRSSG